MITTYCRGDKLFKNEELELITEYLVNQRKSLISLMEKINEGDEEKDIVKFLNIISFNIVDLLDYPFLHLIPEKDWQQYIDLFTANAKSSAIEKILKQKGL